MANKLFRLQSLTANSATFADPSALNHTLKQSVTNTPKKIGASTESLNRVEMKEIVPRVFTDGTANVTIDQVVGVTFSGYTSTDSVKDLSNAWERMKKNVDLAIADGALIGFRSEGVKFIAEISA